MRGLLLYGERNILKSGSRVHHTNGGSGRGDTHSKIPVLWKPLEKHISYENMALGSPHSHLNSAVGTVHEETTHASSSYDALSQEDQPIASLIFRALLAVEAQSEITQAYQSTSHPHDSPMKMCVEKAAHDK